MTALQNIESYISNNNLGEALSRLDEYLATNADDDRALYLRGKVFWRKGELRRAMNDFSAATALNPESDAKQALNQINEILAFYNRDLYNP